MDERLEQGIAEFNEGRFYEAHETLESLWQEYRGDDRLFLQGLIQLAAGCYHLEHGNARGAERQLKKALVKLEPYLPAHGRLALEVPIRQARALLGHLCAAQESSRSLSEPLPFPVFG